jgi:cation transporter-like permease
MPEVLRIYLAGVAILLGAIVINMLAGVVGLKTWYDVLKPIPEIGLAAVARSLTVMDVLFLFVLYPALLGLCGYLVMRGRI